MSKTILQVRPDGDGELSTILDAFLDGTYAHITEYVDLAIAEGPTTTSGAGRPSVMLLEVELNLDKIEDEEKINQLLAALRQTANGMVRLNIQFK